ncbi:TPA: hypothetical protein RJO74_002975 [Enterobacter hormaechei]|nr:hypothetical protein [Enterobacter hormaechei]
MDTSSGCFGGVLATFRYSTELIILGISSVITLMESASIEALSFIVQLRPVSAHPKATSFGGDESSPCHLVKEHCQSVPFGYQRPADGVKNTVGILISKYPKYLFLMSLGQANEY